jgi:pyrroloquinoline quinone biosynthesis protein E
MTDPPVSLIAELTHDCPLRCVYCSNPFRLVQPELELDAAEWQRVLREAAALGVLQLHLSGGEPLLRCDLESLVAEAAERGVYTNLITSGIGLTAERAAGLRAAGLRNVQISLQGDGAGTADVVAGRKAHAAKLAAAATVREAGLALTMNVVIHRHNIERVGQIIDLCVALGAERLELANVQYYGWALLNRRGLLPTAGQVSAAEAVYNERKRALGRAIELVWVLADYHEPYPKLCMGGWGRHSLTVTPDGRVLPCPAASSITEMEFPDIRSHSLGWIWESSPAFNAYRGLRWMQEPCRSCDRRFIDGGGCRCQAFALTGDATRTDPVCRWAPDHDLVTEALADTRPADSLAPGVSVLVRRGELVYRGRRADRRQTAGPSLDPLSASSQL